MSRNIKCLIFFLFISFTILAQNDEGYKFKIQKQIKTTPVKDQYRSSTCWSFSSLAMIESELLQMGKEELDLSEMFVVRHIYAAKAEMYVRMQGNITFGEGGQFHDVMNVIRKYGMVPEEAYPGLNYGEEKHVHGEIEAVLKGMLDQVIKNENKKLSPAWKNAVNGVLDAYFGKLPENFSYKGKNYTPTSFAKDMLSINPDDYIEITSFTHHPFYEKFAMEVPDNWSMGSVYNVPIEELGQIIDNSINNGYTIGWGSDISEKGFSWKNGVAIVPDREKVELAGLEQAKWDKSISKSDDFLYTFKNPIAEKKITQELRQEAFDNYQTQDDHGMQICGIAKDQTGAKFYYVKNSWGFGSNGYDGYFYASESYVLYKTSLIIVNKKAVPKNIADKLKL